MATIHSLPPETLYRIFELGALRLPLPGPPSPASYDFLRSASLVSHSWRAQAQPVLWRRVYIWDQLGAESFVAASRGREEGFGTGELLAFDCDEDELEGGLGELLEACIGLLYLRLGGRSGPVAALYAPSLQGTRFRYQFSL